MAITQELSAALAATLNGLSHAVTMVDDNGKGTLDGKSAVYFYIKDKQVMVFINHSNTDVEIWFDPAKIDKKWIANSLKPHIHGVARQYLYGITVKSYSGDIEPKKFMHRIAESRNTSKTSYHPLGSTKIIIRHSKTVNEEKPGARSRNINAIFIENSGERFRFPYNHLLGARVMGLHVESGGRPWDDLGEKILEISRRRREIMELLRWSKKLEETDQISKIKSRAEDEVLMIRRIMERAARSGDLEGIRNYQLPSKDKLLDQTMVSEAVGELDSALDKILG